MAKMTKTTTLVNIKLKYFRVLLFVIVSGAPSNVEKPSVPKIISPIGPQHNNIEGGSIHKRFQKTSTCFSLILSRVVGYNPKHFLTHMLFPDMRHGLCVCDAYTSVPTQA